MKQTPDLSPVQPENPPLPTAEAMRQVTASASNGLWNEVVATIEAAAKEGQYWVMVPAFLEHWVPAFEKAGYTITELGDEDDEDYDDGPEEATHMARISWTPEPKVRSFRRR